MLSLKNSMWTCGHWSKRKKTQKQQPSFKWFILFFLVFFRQSHVWTAYGQQYHGVCFSYPFECNSWKLSVCLLIRIRIFITSSNPFLALSFCLFCCCVSFETMEKSYNVGFFVFFHSVKWKFLIYHRPSVSHVKSSFLERRLVTSCFSSQKGNNNSLSKTIVNGNICQW